MEQDGFRSVSRQQQDRFRNKLFCRLFCHLFAALLLTFLGLLFSAFLSMQYKWRAILSMQYKSLLHVFWGVGGV